jgi:hypothetical protein
MADVLASPSPTLSPSSSFHSLHRSVSRLNAASTSSTTTSPTGRTPTQQYASTSTPFTTPAQPLAQQTQNSNSMSSRNTVDTGTQYTPPGYPPTAFTSRTTTSAAATTSKQLHQAMESRGVLESPDSVHISPAEHMDTSGATTNDTSPTEPPPEPGLRQDPEPHVSPDADTNADTNANANAVADTAADAIPAGAESPIKKTKATPSGIIIMPRDYMKCDVRHLGVVISHMLMELVHLNDPMPFKNDKLTRFHSRYVTPAVARLTHLTPL